MLLEGKAHAYVFASKGCKRWDTCAPEGILKALAGKLTDIHGKEYDYSKWVENISKFNYLISIWKFSGMYLTQMLKVYLLRQDM